ncbi:WASH complex subunit 2A isoform X2 [Halyomorpha halys]
MREQRKVWSLQHDVDLLNNLETFSQGLIKKTCFLLDSMEEFHREINMTGVEVKTVSNCFEGVSDSQFVENRVYDEEDVMICEDDKPVNDSTTLNLNKRLEESLKQCAKTLESKFEELNITMSDSEEDIDVFNKGEVILVPKNRYKSRPLPHLFGGQDFFSDDSLGLLPSKHIEDVGENLISGGDDNVHHYESSSIDEIDNCTPKDNLFTTTASEIKEVSSQEQNEGAMVENRKNDSKQTSIQDEQLMNDCFIEKKSDSRPPIDNLNPSSFNNITQGAQMNTAIADEIKGIFGEENYEGHAKSPVLRKIGRIINEETIKKNVEQIHEVKDSPEGIKERFSEVPVPPLFNEPSWPQRESPKETKIGHFPKNVPFKTNFPPQINQYREEKMSEEDVLPYVPTEVLHSFAKSRPKIKGKRRLPTRKQKNILHDNEANKVKHLFQDNVLSPSTDEEDLFMIPNVTIPKETSSDSLFGGPSLFSPGSFIEGETKTAFTSSVRKKEEKLDIDEKEDIEEPLGIKKSQFESDKRNSNFFSDWDPFNTDDSVLFSSVERKTRKTKLFDDIEGSSSQKSSKDTDDDDLFLFPSSNTSNSASSLFSTSISSKGGFTTSNSDFSRVSKLFNEDRSSENLFSSSKRDDISTLENSIGNLNFNRQPDFGSKLSGNKLLTDEKRENALYSNPLMDTDDDNLFD